jgi:hypothetical protein
MTDTTADPKTDAGLQIQHALENAISTAIETARNRAANDPFLGQPTRRRADDYYTFVALHRLFLVACGADAETHKGGDVRKASRILHVGGTIARGWQRDDVGSHEIKLPGGPGPSEEDLKNREELRLSAERLVGDIIMKALVEHVSKEDAEFRGHISLAIEERIPTDDSGSEQAKMFAEFVRSSTGHLLDKLQTSADRVSAGDLD